MASDESRTAAFFQRIAPDYEPLARYSTAALDELSHDILDALRGWSHGRLLDVAAGTGFPSRRLSTLLPGFALIQMDLAPSMATAAQLQRGDDATVLVGHVEALPMRSESISLLTSYCAVHCFPNLPAFLREARRVMLPGGIISLAFNDRNHLSRQLVHQLFPHFHNRDIGRQLSVRDLTDRLTSSEFAIVRTGSHEWSQNFQSATDYLDFIRKRPFSGFAAYTDTEFAAAFTLFVQSIQMRYPGNDPLATEGTLDWAIARRVS